MESITVKNIKINLDIINPQTSTLGREFVLSQIKLDVSKAPIDISNQQVWKLKVWRHCTWYIFKYIDDGSEFGFYFDEYDKFTYKLTDADVKKLNAIHKNN
jgi:hypothetical protein